MKPSVKLGNDTFKAAFVGHCPAIILVMKTDVFFARTIKDGLSGLHRQLGKGGLKREAIMLGNRGKDLTGIGCLLSPAPGGNRPVDNTLCLIRDDQGRIKELLHPESAAFRAGALRIVEGKKLGRRRWKGDRAPMTGRMFAEKLFSSLRQQNTTRRKPPDSLTAVLTESDSRRRRESLMTNRSMTTSMVCLRFLSRSGIHRLSAGPRHRFGPGQILPCGYARESVHVCPFWAATRGARSRIFVPSS